MSHNKPRANAPWKYGGNHRDDSIAGAWNAYEATIRPGPSIEWLNQSSYKVFCQLANDVYFRSTVFANATARYAPWGKFK